MQDIQELVYKHLLHAQKAQKYQADKHHRDVEYTMSHELEDSVKHEESQVEASQEAPGLSCGTVWGVEVSMINCLQVNFLHNTALKTIYPVSYVSLLRDFLIEATFN